MLPPYGTDGVEQQARRKHSPPLVSTEVQRRSTRRIKKARSLWLLWLVFKGPTKHRMQFPATAGQHWRGQIVLWLLEYNASVFMVLMCWIRTCAMHKQKKKTTGLRNHTKVSWQLQLRL